MKYIMNHPIRKKTRPEERPREKILIGGAKGLSDLALLSILIGSGGKENSVDTIAEEVLKHIDQGEDISELAKQKQIKGLGPAKASLIMAALELGRRLSFTKKRRISYPGDAYPIVQHYADRLQEHFIRISLNGAHEVLSVGVVSIGLVNRTIVHPREVFSDPLKERATAIIVAHNHPSGNLLPSQEDKAMTKRLREAGELLGIQLLDHLIFSDEGYYSLLEKGDV